MRVVDLALFSDLVCARIASVEARLERARDRIRQASIEREARRALAPATVELLVRAGALTETDVRGERREIAELAATLAALHELQRWTEKQLFNAREDPADGDASLTDLGLRGPPRAA
jgi:hypothetical protein